MTQLVAEVDVYQTFSDLVELMIRYQPPESLCSLLTKRSAHYLKLIRRPQLRCDSKLLMRRILRSLTKTTTSLMVVDRNKSDKRSRLNQLRNQMHQIDSRLILLCLLLTHYQFSQIFTFFALSDAWYSSLIVFSQIFIVDSVSGEHSDVEWDEIEESLRNLQVIAHVSGRTEAPSMGSRRKLWGTTRHRFKFMDVKYVVCSRPDLCIIIPNNPLDAPTFSTSTSTKYF